MKTQLWIGLALIGVTALGTACNRSKTIPSDGPDRVDESLETGSASTQQQEDAEPILEPFDAPALADVEARVTWVDLPVVDSMKLRRGQQAEEKPLVTAASALRLKNDSAQNNAKILTALGRLPENDDQVNWDGTLIKHISGDVKSVNPLMQSSVYEADVLGLVGFGMFGFDWNLQPFALAEHVVSWQTSEDRLIDKVVMRDDLTWSDGQPITAHDVVFSFQTIMDPRVPVPAVRAMTDQIRWIEAYDDHTMLIFHLESTPVNVWNVNFPVIPQHIYKDSIAEDPTLQKSEYHAKYEREPVSGGPYKVIKRERGQEVIVERREDYYLQNGRQVRDKPYFKRIRFRVIEDPNTMILALRAGEIDECVLDPELWQTQTNDDEYYGRNTKATGPEWSEYHIVWNCQTPFFSDVRVRRAMSYAFDYREMLDKQFYGLYQPAIGPFHRDSWMAPPDPAAPYEQDLDKAEDLLDAAGWDDSDGDGVRDKEIDGRLLPFEFRLICGNHPRPITIGENLKESLERIGINCEIRPLETTVWQQNQRDHKFHAALGGWGAGADPSTTINVFGTGENRNYGLYSNKRVDELFQQGRSEFDHEKRRAIFIEIHKILYDDQPYTWLFNRSSFYGFNRRLRGYKFSPRGPYHYNPGVSSVWEALAN